MEKKEYTFSKNVMLIDNQTETGRTWIKEYIERFEDTKRIMRHQLCNIVTLNLNTTCNLHCKWCYNTGKTTQVIKV